MRVQCLRALILSIALCAVDLSAQAIDPTAATVRLTKAQTISVQTLNAELSSFERLWKAQNRPFTDQDRSDVLWRMIDLVLFRQAAERDHVRVSDDHLNIAVERSRQLLSSQLGRQATERDLRSQITLEGLTWEAWIESLRLEALPEVYTAQVKGEALRNVPAPTELDIQFYYRTNIQQFVMGDLAEFRHIFVDTRKKTAVELETARKKIEDIALRLRNGESFEELVTRYSEDKDSRDRQGWAGTIRADQADAKALGPQFVEGLFALQEGQTSGILQSPAGYHIAKLVLKVPAKLYSLPDRTPPYYDQVVRDVIRSTLAATRQSEALAAEIQKVKLELRAQAEISIVERNLGFALKKPS